MYKSPIKIFESPIHDVIMQMYEGKENYIYQCLADIGVNIDKDELIRALQYDRDQYEQGYRDGKQVNKWISVKDRLPTESQKCLVYYKHCYAEDDFCAVDTAFYVDGTEEFLGIDPRYYVVTYWMPLPEPPKED